MRRLALLAIAFAVAAAVPASSVLAAKAPSAAVKIATGTARARFHTTRIVSVFSLRSRLDSRWALVDGFATARNRPWAAWLHRDRYRWTLRYFDTRAPFQPGSTRHGRVPCDLYPAFSEPSCRPVGAAHLRPTASVASPQVSGSITNVHATDGQVSATYTTSFQICTGTYCGWFAHAYQYPATQSCAPNGSHLTYVGDLHSTSGSETVTDDFTPAYDGQIRICLYAYHSGNNYYVADGLFTPSSTMSGAIENVHAVAGGKIAATYVTNFRVCTTGYCGWFAHAWQLPASQPCSVDKSHLTYVGDSHSAGGSERATDDFYPRYDAGRICLYVYHSGKEYFIADALYFRTPSPTRSSTITVGPQRVSYYYPRGCVLAGRSVQLRLVILSTGSRLPITRVEFRLDQMRRTVRHPKWQTSFPTTGFVPRSLHRASAKITFRQRGRRAPIIRTVTKTFRTC